MKLTVVFLTVALLNVSAKGVSQSISFSADHASLKEVFAVIKKQTGYVILYNKAYLNDTKPVSLSAANMPLKIFLDQVFKDQPLNYSIEDNTISLSRKVSALPKNVDDLIPPIKISGTVYGNNNQPLIGATVRVKGKNIITTTNEQGYFELSADGGSILVISYVGFEPTEYKITTAVIASSDRQSSNITDIRIILKQSNNTLDTTAVVSTGYQSLPRERATGSFSQVNNRLFNRRVSSDVISRLEGAVPGLLFNRNIIGGTNDNNISIRGNSTLFANNQPLIVVDGFPYDGDLSNINPNTVESVSVLKDAAAASIWGVRSGNGVIVIQTKKGRRNQKISVTLNSNITIGDRPYINKNPNFLDAGNYIEIEKQLFSKGYFDGAINTNYKLLSPVIQTLADARDGRIDQATANAEIEALTKNDIRKDISKYLHRKTVNQQYALNFSGGGDKNDYFFSVGWDKNLTNLKGNENRRVTLNGDLNFYPIRNLTVSVGLNYNQQEAQQNAPILAGTLYPYVRLADDNGVSLNVPKDFSDHFKDSMFAQGFLDWQYKPNDELNAVSNTKKLIDNQINASLKYHILPNLNAEIKFQYQNQSISGERYSSLESYQARDLINRYTDLNGSNKYPIPLGGILEQSMTGLTAKRLRGQLNYSNSWAAIHELSAIAGVERNEVINESQNNITYGYDATTRNNTSRIDYNTWYPLHPVGISQIPYNIAFDQSTDHYLSYYGNAAYTFMKKYTLSASGRIDKSNLFGVSTNQKSIPLYSAGFAWLLSEEAFYKWYALPYFKIRGTYGYNGNINKSATAQTTVSQSNNSYFFGQPYDIIQNPGNPELRWEKVKMVNIGIDVASKNQRITASVEYFWKKGIDLFGNTPLAPSTGLSAFFGNIASIKGHGLDMLINMRNIEGKNFQWTTHLSASSVTDKITDYEEEIISSMNFIMSSSASSIFPIIGKPLYGMYSYRSAGLTHETGDPQGFLDDKVSKDYRAIITSTAIDSLHFHGSARPTTFGFLRNDFSFKGFTLSVNIVYKLNYYFRRSSISYGNLFAGAAGHRDFVNRWRNPGDESKTDVPSLQYPPVDSDRETFYSLSDALVEKGDHVRLQDIGFSYDLKRFWKKNSFFAMLDLYGYISNIGIIWKANRSDLDPDISGGVPIPKSYSIGVKTTF